MKQLYCKLLSKNPKWLPVILTVIKLLYFTGMGGIIHYLILVTTTQKVSMTTTNIILNIKLLCINLNGAYHNKIVKYNTFSQVTIP